MNLFLFPIKINGIVENKANIDIKKIFTID